MTSEAIRSVYFALKQTCHPDQDSGYASPDAAACAAFSEESRMKFVNATTSTGNPGDRSGGTCCSPTL
jgi:hypothetical protein